MVLHLQLTTVLGICRQWRTTVCNTLKICVSARIYFINCTFKNGVIRWYVLYSAMAEILGGPMEEYGLLLMRKWHILQGTILVYGAKKPKAAFQQPLINISYKPCIACQTFMGICPTQHKKCPLCLWPLRKPLCAYQVWQG